MKNLPLADFDVFRQMFSLLGYRFGNDLLVILLSTCSWHPVVWCCQRDVRCQVLWEQKEIASKEEIELYTFQRIGRGLQRVWTVLFKPLTFLGNTKGYLVTKSD